MTDRLTGCMRELTAARREAAGALRALRTVRQERDAARECLRELNQLTRGTLRIPPRLRARIAALVKQDDSASEAERNGAVRETVE